MTGILYGVGVGPGDPELMTLKAARLIRETEVIALPGTAAEETVAYQIAVQAVPELSKKTLVPVAMPMTHDKEEMRRNHDKAADLLEIYLAKEENVVFLTLG
ncbi:MAG: precorrin-2 C(20)-methyltransferase, partial [Lachnospiraceae bacterium]|nr:precorrin-2 C(20)-methyltransferase [Lachnospiraceae bacterium]